MSFPWTVLFETDIGEVKAENILANAQPIEALASASVRFKGVRVLGIIKGSHADCVYGVQILQGAPNSDQLSIPFPGGPQEGDGLV